MPETDLSVLEGATGSAAELPPPEPNLELATDDDVPAEAGQPYIGIRTPYRAASKPAQIPQVSDEATYNAVPMGSAYLDPEGNKRTKPYKATSAADYEKIPEGSNYTDPEGNARKKPKFEPVSFTTQTLYDMALTDKERRKILEKEYGKDRVQQDSRGLFAVDENGTYRKPGYGMTALGGGLTAAAAPVTASILGAIGGGVAGVAGGPPGVFVGGMAGAGGGGLAGQAVNDLVLQWAGVYDRTPSEQFSNLGTAGLMSMAGAGVGRGIAAVAPTIREGISHSTQVGPAVARYFTGAKPDEIQIAKGIMDKGGAVPPSAVLHEMPHLQNVVERYGPGFDTSNPLKRKVEGYYEGQSGDVLRDLGVPEFQGATRPSLLKPETAVSTQPVGEALRARAIQESATADQALDAAIAARTAVAEIDSAGQQTQNQLLTREAERARQAAQRVVDNIYTEIDHTADAAMRVARVGRNSGELWQAVGDQLRATKQGLTARGSRMYQVADELAGDARPNIAGVPQAAQQVLEQLPDDFRRAYPMTVQRLQRLSGEFDAEGQMVRPPIQPTFGELHNIRSLLRYEADWTTLSGDFKNGALKHLEHRVDNALHDIRSVPALRPAVEQLDLADAFWRENMPVFQARQIKTIMKGLEAGEPADPQVLYNAIVKEGHTDLVGRIREMVGPNLWRGVQGTDLRVMLNNSRDLADGVFDGRKFVGEVLDRHRRGLLETVHGPEMARQLRQQAEAIRAFTDARIPIQVRPGDTPMEVIARARAATENAARVADADPLLALQREMGEITKQERARPGRPGGQDDPLAFLLDPTVGAAEAAKKILSKDDLIVATAQRFGVNSKEFEMLRQAYAYQLLQGNLRPGRKLEKITEEMQQLMFPGVTSEAMQTLAKEMALLTNTQLFKSSTAAGMMVQSKIEHPITKTLPLTSVINVPVRGALGAYFALVRKVVAEKPWLINYLAKGLNGTEEEKQVVRAILTKHAQRYSGMGAGAGEMLYQRGQGEQREPPR